MLSGPLMSRLHLKVCQSHFRKLPQRDRHRLLHQAEPILYIASRLHLLQKTIMVIHELLQCTQSINLYKLTEVRTFCRVTLSFSGEIIARMSLVTVGGAPGSAEGMVPNSRLEYDTAQMKYVPGSQCIRTYFTLFNL